MPVCVSTIGKVIASCGTTKPLVGDCVIQHRLIARLPFPAREDIREVQLKVACSEDVLRQSSFAVTESLLIVGGDNDGDVGAVQSTNRITEKAILRFTSAWRAVVGGRLLDDVGGKRAKCLSHATKHRRHCLTRQGEPLLQLTVGDSLPTSGERA